MKRIAVMLVEGFEIVEAFFPIDLMKRTKLIQVDIIGEKEEVYSSQNDKIKVDKLLEYVDFDKYDAIFLPGGPGTSNYEKYDELLKALKNFKNKNRLIAAICAAPHILAKQGLLEGIKSTIYPGMEKYLIDNKAIYTNESVVKDGNIITGRSVASSCDFGLCMIEYMLGEKVAFNLKKQIVYK